MAGREGMIQEAREMVALYTKAEKAVLLGQAYTVAGQSVTRADLDKLRAGRKEWEERLAQYLGRQPRVVWRVMPMDD